MRPIEKAVTVLALFAITTGCGSPHALRRDEVDGVVEKLGGGDAAEQSLAMTEPDISWGPLVRLFEDPAKSKPAARSAAIRLFMQGATYDRDLPYPAAEAVANDPDVGVRREALHAILTFGKPANRVYLEEAKAKEKDPALLAELGKALDEQWPTETRRWWRARLAGPSTPSDLMLAIRGLGNSQYREEAAPLIAAFEPHAETSARYEIVIALGHLGGPEAMAFVRKQLVSEDPYVRTAAAAMEITLKDPEAVEALGVMLGDDNVGDTRVSAARALKAIGGPAAAKAVAKGCAAPAPAKNIQDECKLAAVALSGKPARH